MLSAVSWVRKGVAMATPLNADLAVEDGALEQMPKDVMQERVFSRKKTQLVSSTKCAVRTTTSSLGVEDEDIHAKYGFDDYSDHEDPSCQDMTDESAQTGRFLDKVFLDLRELSMVDGASDEDVDVDSDGQSMVALDSGRDEHLVPQATDENSDFEEPEDQDDLQLRPSDYLLVSARAPEDDDIAQLEFYVYEEELDNLYVHHDVMLPAYPLCLECICAPLGGAAAVDTGKNYVAVGTFDPEIEIWNLDVLDPVLPSLILGPSTLASKPKPSSKPTKAPKSCADYHTDAVLAIAWNKQQPNLLASASADKSIKLWDLASCQPLPSSTKTSSCPSIKALRSFDDVHSDKIQCLAWNPSPVKASLLASAAYDKTLCVFDVRMPAQRLYYRLHGDAEALKWNPFNENELVVSDDSGMVHYLDVTLLSSDPTLSKALFTFQAHPKATTCLDFHPAVPSLLLTASLDKTFCIWDLGHATASSSLTKAPVPIITKNVASLIGKIFAASFSHDHPCMIVVTGKSNELPYIWKLSPESLSLSTKKPPRKPKLKKRTAAEQPTDDDDDDELENNDAEKRALHDAAPLPLDALVLLKDIITARI